MKFNFKYKSFILLSGLILIGCQEEKTANLEPVIRPVKLIEVNSLVEASKRIFPARIEANQKAEKMAEEAAA